MRIKIESTNEKITRRSGMILTNEFGKRIEVSRIVDEEFPRPGSNHGFAASRYVTTLVEMFHDGALYLEDVRHLMSDHAYQELVEHDGYPTSDAIGDWLRRHGETGGEEHTWNIQRRVLALFEKMHTPAKNATHTTRITEEKRVSESEVQYTLDIDATIIECEKGDATKTYKNSWGYQPLLAIIAENGVVAGCDFRLGHHSPQSGLRDFVRRCEATVPWRIDCVRSDSAGYNKSLIEDIMSRRLFFTITADHTTAVLEAVEAIVPEQWKHGVQRDGARAEWDVAETTHTFSSKKKTFRLVIKRTPLDAQGDLFVRYTYWIVATNLPADHYDANRVILYHQGRGEMEKTIGELKHHWNLDHMPCGQYKANALYFTIGLFAYNLMQMVKMLTLPEEAVKKSVRTIRYQLLHLAGRVIRHARYLLVRLAAPPERVQELAGMYLRLHLSPIPL